MRPVLPVLAVVAGLLLAGCSPDDVDVAGPATSLTVNLNPGEGEPIQEWTLTCQPAGGTHPDPEAACAVLDDLDPSVLAPVPPDQACTMIYGGPQTATVTGTWDGQPVDAEFSRQNGCEIDRWDTVADLLVDRGGGLTT